MKSLFITIFTVTLLLMSSCQKDDNNPINNTNFSGKNGGIVSSKGTVNFNFGSGRFIIEENSTLISLVSIAGENSGNSSNIRFKGKSVGEFPLNENNLFIILINNELFYSEDGTGSIKVTSYGAVGKEIKGTYSGQLRGVNNTTLTVTAAEFSVIRSSDVIDDDDPNDDDDDEDYKKGEFYGTMIIDGKSTTYNEKNIETNANVSLIDNLYTISFAMGIYDDESGFDIAFLSNLKTNNSNSGQVLNLTTDNSESMVMVQIGNVLYALEGTAKLLIFPDVVGKFFEVELNGKIIKIVDKVEVGQVVNLKLRLVRSS